MELKADVQWVNMHPSMEVVREVIDEPTQAICGRDAVCTSARRPQTQGGSSLHPKGKAVDLRTIDLDVETQRDYARAVSALLGPMFDVVLEGPAAFDERYRDRVAHLHVEFDP